MDKIQSPVLTKQLLMHFVKSELIFDEVRMAYLLRSCIGNSVEWVAYRMAARAEDYHG